MHAPHSDFEFIRISGFSPIINRDSPICLPRVWRHTLSSLKMNLGASEGWWSAWCFTKALVESSVLRAVWCSHALSPKVLWVSPQYFIPQVLHVMLYVQFLFLQLPSLSRQGAQFSLWQCCSRGSYCLGCCSSWGPRFLPF